VQNMRRFKSSGGALVEALSIGNPALSPRRQASQGPESIDVGDQSRTLCCRRFFFASQN
jgi:hypothetical protein